MNFFDEIPTLESYILVYHNIQIVYLDLLYNTKVPFHPYQDFYNSFSEISDILVGDWVDGDSF